MIFGRCLNLLEGTSEKGGETLRIPGKVVDVINKIVTQPIQRLKSLNVSGCARRTRSANGVAVSGPAS